MECSPEEPGGVEGVEWWDSHRGNRRDPSPPQQRDPAGCRPSGGLGAASRISRDPVKAGSAERESERPIVPLRWRTTQPPRREGAVLGRSVRRG